MTLEFLAFLGSAGMLEGGKAGLHPACQRGEMCFRVQGSLQGPHRETKKTTSSMFKGKHILYKVQVDFFKTETKLDFSLAGYEHQGPCLRTDRVNEIFLHSSRRHSQMILV